MANVRCNTIVVSVFLVTVALASHMSCREATAQTATATDNPTTVILLGTLHGAHDHARDYATTDLRDIIIDAAPAAILFEMPPTIAGQPTAIDGRIDPAYQGNESIAVNQAADTLDVPAVPYDRDRRNERYQETRYFERQNHALQRLMEWTEQCDDAPTIAAGSVALNCVFQGIQGAQMSIALEAGPRVVNSAAFDQLTESAQCLVHDLIPPLIADAAMDTVAADLAFLADEWNTRNAIMADNIENAARRYPGQRIVVLCGAEHRYILRRLLQDRAAIRVREYYEID